jgi:glutaredoxin 3
MTNMESTSMPPVKIYTKSWCPYCRSAKELLTEKGLDFEEIDIERHPEARATMIQESGGRTTVPQIFIGGRHIGGCDDLYALESEGGLDPLLTA